MKVDGSAPKAQASEAKSKTKDVEAEPKAKSEEKESPKPADAGDTFEEAKSKPPVFLASADGDKNMRDGMQACDAANAGKPAPEGQFTKEDARAAMMETPEGRRIVEDWDKLAAKGLNIENKDMCGVAAGQWDEKSRTIAVDPKSYASIEGYTQTLAHELTHASQSDGLNPARDGAPKPMEAFNNGQDYGDHAMEMEARAEARAYDLARDRNFPASSFQGLRDLYDAAVDGATGTPEERREAGVQAMVKSMRDGSAGASWQTERQTYVDDYNRRFPVAAASGAVQ